MASEGAKWPLNSLEHALELELNIQEADMRLVRELSLCSPVSMQFHQCQIAANHVSFDHEFLVVD